MKFPNRSSSSKNLYYSRVVIDLHDFSTDLQMLTDDLGAMDLQTVTEI